MKAGTALLLVAGIPFSNAGSANDWDSRGEHLFSGSARAAADRGEGYGPSSTELEGGPGQAQGHQERQCEEGDTQNIVTADSILSPPASPFKKTGKGTAIFPAVAWHVPR